jgi:hypothetical protein
MAAVTHRSNMPCNVLTYTSITTGDSPANTMHSLAAGLRLQTRPWHRAILAATNTDAPGGSM